MPVLYPYTLPDLNGSGARPTDGKPIRAVHFNRSFREITAIQAALGEGDQLRGDLASLKARLAVNMNNDGSLKQEMICDNDQSGNERGGYRYFDSEAKIASLSAGKTRVLVRLSYTHYREPPVFIGCVAHANADTWLANVASQAVEAVSEIGCRLTLRQSDGSAPTAAVSFRYHWLTISSEPIVWEDNVGWAMKPVRIGGG